MKRMKQFAALALAAAMLLTVLAGCGMSKGTIQEGIFYDAAGVSPDAVLLRIDGVDITAERYFYWLSSMTANVVSYYGDDAWEKADDDGETYGQRCFDYALDNAKQYAVIENWAKEKNITLTDEQLAEIDKEVDGYQEQYGDFIFKYWGFSSDTMKYFYRIFDYFDAIQAATLEEGSDWYPTEEQLAAYQKDEGLLKADHILLATVDLTTGEALSDEEIAAKYAKAQELLQQLRASDDPETLFTQLANENSEDTGRAANPDGYVFGTENSMDEAFAKAAQSLAVGEISDIVKGSYGYHIILRRELTRDDLLNDSYGYFNYLLNQACDQAKVETSKLYTDKVLTMDLGAFNTAVTDARNTIYTDYQNSLTASGAEDGTDASGNTDTSGTTGSGTTGSGTTGDSATAGSGTADSGTADSAG